MVSPCSKNGRISTSLVSTRLLRWLTPLKPESVEHLSRYTLMEAAEVIG
jgi:hypothetical protein